MTHASILLINSQSLKPQAYSAYGEQGLSTVRFVFYPYIMIVPLRSAIMLNFLSSLVGVML